MSHTSALDVVAAFLNSMIEPGIDPLWSVEHLRWKLDNHPAGPGVLAFATVDDAVVSTLTISRRHMWWRGRRLDAGELGDAYTHPDFRGPWNCRPSPIVHLVGPEGHRFRRTELTRHLSLFSFLTGCCHRAARRLGIELIYGTPNDRSASGLIRWSGYSPHSMMLDSMERPPSTGIQRIPKSEVREVDWDSPELDRLWFRLRGQNELGPVRDGVYFRHRFAANPLAHYNLWGLWRASKLVAVSVSRQHIVVPDRRDLCLADWFYDSAHPDELDLLLSHTLAAAGPGLHATAWVGEGRPEAAILKSLGFSSRWRIPIIVHQSGLGPQVRRCVTFDFTVATSDNI